MTPVILVDSNNLMYRAHFSHQYLTNKRGDPTGVMHGFFNNVLAVAKKWPKSPMIFCWDSLHGSWRRDLASTYKANRVRDPNLSAAINPQRDMVRSVLKGFGFHDLRVYRLEADDLIAMLATRIKRDRDVLIYSADKDYYQCVSQQVKILRPTATGLSLVDMAGVLADAGVPPNRFLSLRAFCGDSSDNYKPVDGIGPKRALEILKAGIDPRCSVDAVRFGKWESKLKPAWADIQLAYKLCELPAATLMPVICLDKARKPLERASKNPNRRKPVGADAERLRKFFFEWTRRYELNDLQHRRDEFWALA
jgi:DNA polymerase-1